MTSFRPLLTAPLQYVRSAIWFVEYEHKTPWYRLVLEGYGLQMLREAATVLDNQGY